jgi:uncharacterized protein (DUF1697 family)
MPQCSLPPERSDQTTSLAVLSSSLSCRRTTIGCFKIIAIEDRLVLGIYQRQMKAITCLGKIEKLLGVPATTRNWNTIEKVVKVLQQGG